MNTATASTPTQTVDSVIGGLHTVLADSYALMAQTQLAHWNVEGSGFFQLHSAFQAQYEELFAAVDEIAERIRALGAYSPGGLATLAAHSEIEELGVESLPASSLVEHLAAGHELVLRHAVQLRDAAEDAGDLETQDMIIARIQVHQKTLWMLRSFLRKR